MLQFKKKTDYMSIENFKNYEQKLRSLKKFKFNF